MKAIKKVLKPRKSIESLFVLLALNNQIQNFTPTLNQDFESRDFSYFETMTFRDQDSRSRLEVQIRGETETRLSKMCLETVSRTETGLENYITNPILKLFYKLSFGIHLWRFPERGISLTISKYLLLKHLLILIKTSALLMDCT